MASYKDYLKKPDFLNIPQTTPVAAATTTPSTTEPKTPTVRKSNYKPQQYNPKTGQVEDIKASGTKMSFKSMKNTNFQEKPILTHEQQVLADYQQKQADAALIASQNPTVAPPEVPLLNTIGTDQPLMYGTPINTQDPLTSSIMQKNRMHDVITPAWGVSGPDTINIVPAIGKKIAAVVAGNNPKVKDFLTDYSNEDNFKSVSKNIELADQQIAAAKAAATEPGYGTQAIQAYNEAMNQKRKSMAQLKQIASGDQKAYVSDVRIKLTELETYFSSEMKLNDDREMRDAVLRSQMVTNGANRP